jgi:hypothetical protein
MDMIRPNIAYDLQLKKAEVSPKTIENNEILHHTDKIYFVICNSCYWCASYFDIDNLRSLSRSSSHILDCHCCNSHNTELMPISTDESFRIKYNVTRGMEIEFYRSNNIITRQQSADK